LWQTALHLGAMVGLLVAATWSGSGGSGAWAQIHAVKWPLTAAFALGLGAVLAAWFGARWREIAGVALLVAIVAALFPNPLAPFAAGVAGLVLLTAGRAGELGEWFDASWQLARQILPLLLLGVLAAGLLLGRPGHEGLIPSEWVTRAVGGNSIASNVFAAVAGAFMYFATLTEVPILQGLLGNGMGKGPALALLLAGPALSLPNMLVIRTVLGTRKTLVYVALVVVMASLSGIVFGRLVP
ncbi:permease, partial [bacterium]|nr:permease [bacterium]